MKLVNPVMVIIEYYMEYNFTYKLNCYYIVKCYCPMYQQIQVFGFCTNGITSRTISGSMLLRCVIDGSKDILHIN